MSSPSSLSRRRFLQSLSFGAAAVGFGGSFARARSDDSVTAHWEHATPEAAGFAPEVFAAVEASLYTTPTTSFLVVRGGKIAYTYGEISQVSYLASARKSVMSLLYGKYVENGTIDLKRTIGDLGIDDLGGLLPIEKTATVRDILMASSGVYHDAGSPGSEGHPPARGSQKPGEHFYYNNWDFNVAGAIFTQLTGKTVFQALADDLAGPLQFQDFDPKRQHMLGYVPTRSRYSAYHLFLSGRDMARLGVLALNGGRWNGRQVVPERWVRAATSLQVPHAASAGNGAMGYGYLWWIPLETSRGPRWKGAFAALGNYGQNILVLPEIDTVIVSRRAVTDEFAVARNLGKTDAAPAGGSISGAAFFGAAEKIAAAAI